jgi:hypothetical protein
MKPSYKEQATNLSLWREYVDPYCALSDEEFGKFSIDKKINYITMVFGPEGLTVDELYDKGSLSITP